MKGFTLMEVLISTAILALIIVGVGKFTQDILSFDRTIFNSLGAEQDGRLVVKTVSKEIRESAPSNTGSFPIAEASSTAITFYTDINNDGFEEQVRYVLVGTSLKKTVISPTGSPLAYTGAGTTTVIASNVYNGVTPIFSYYDGNYTGTSSPLTQPVNPQQVRLIQVTLVIEQDPNKLPVPMTFTTQVEIRNLKDNL